MEKEADRKNGKSFLRREFDEMCEALCIDRATVVRLTAGIIKWCIGALIFAGITGGLLGGILYFIEVERQHLYK
jgi:hypothetical protein